MHFQGVFMLLDVLIMAAGMSGSIQLPGYDEAFIESNVLLAGSVAGERHQSFVT